MSSTHCFVDESKANAYVLVAVKVSSQEIKRVRKTLSSLQLPGQSRIHMKKERDARKQKILSEIANLNLEISLYVVPSRSHNEITRRRMCLRKLVEDAHVHGVQRLCIERDLTLEQHDKQLLIEVKRSLGFHELVYWHDSAAAEPLLSLPDAIAWAWSKGGKWAAACGNVTIKQLLV
jgi:hypothetical protein